MNADRHRIVLCVRESWEAHRKACSMSLCVAVDAKQEALRVGEHARGSATMGSQMSLCAGAGIQRHSGCFAAYQT
jgi:hypothetical protein